MAYDELVPVTLGGEGHTPEHHAALKEMYDDLRAVPDGSFAVKQAGVWVPVDLGDYQTEAEASAAYAPDKIARAALGLDGIVAYDTFNRSDGAVGTSDSGHVWAGQTAVVAIESNKLRSTSAAPFVWIDAATAHVDLSVRLAPYDQFVALAARITDANNLLALDVSAGIVRLRKREAGDFTVLAQANVPTIVGRHYSLRLLARGSRVRGFMDGVQLIDHTLAGGDETAFAAQTLCGVRANATINNPRLDDFVVRQA